LWCSHKTVLALFLPLQAASEAEVDRLSGQLQESIVSAEVGRAKVLLYDELSAKAEKLVRSRAVLCRLCGWRSSSSSSTCEHL
jgi:hypothetical protein